MSGFQHSCGYVNDSRWVHGRGQSATDKWLTQWRQITEMVTSSSQLSQAGSDEDEEGEQESASVQEEHISSSTAVNAIDMLMRYFEQCLL